MMAWAWRDVILGVVIGGLPALAVVLYVAHLIPKDDDGGDWGDDE